MDAPSASALPLLADLRQVEQLGRLRDGQRAWRAWPLRRRLAVVCACRERLADDGLHLAASVRPDSSRALHETITAELLPLLAACRFLERDAPRLLAPRVLGARGRPIWLASGEGEVRRDAYGVVLVIGPSNYPLFLPGVQTLQALVAGNAVLWKPGKGGAACAHALRAALVAAGLPGDVLAIGDESVAQAQSAIEAGVDKIVLTGHVETGRAVLARAALHPVPAVMELSGCDAMIVCADADPVLAAEAAAFGLAFNAGATCIAPRRVLVVPAVAAAFRAALLASLPRVPAAQVDVATVRRLHALVDAALAGGARLLAGEVGEDPGAGAAFARVAPTVLAEVSPGMAIADSDIFAPLLSIVPVPDEDAAVDIVNASAYRLGASVFGAPRSARAIAARLDVGTVTVNDLIVPTADPRAPFGGRGASGFGVTRGEEGLLDMTQPKVVWHKSARRRLHHRAVDAIVARVITALPALCYGKAHTRFNALRTLVRDIVRHRPNRAQEHSA
jgi:acyl-CoA reductase-like NAD-dependent aldehyde dehydrogenase